MRLGSDNWCRQRVELGLQSLRCRQKGHLRSFPSLSSAWQVARAAPEEAAAHAQAYIQTRAFGPIWLLFGSCKFVTKASRRIVFYLPHSKQAGMAGRRLSGNKLSLGLSKAGKAVIAHRQHRINQNHHNTKANRFITKLWCPLTSSETLPCMGRAFGRRRLPNCAKVSQKWI